MELEGGGKKNHSASQSTIYLKQSQFAQLQLETISLVGSVNS